jgi:CBS domain-containing protein
MSWTVSDVMTRDVVTVKPSASFNACVRTMRLHGVGALPVVTDHKVLGIIAMTDLVLRERRPSARERYAGDAASSAQRNPLNAATLMSSPVITVSPQTPLPAAARLLFEHRINRLPVIDENGALAGIVSRSDMLRMFLRSDIAIRREVDSSVVADMPVFGRGAVVADVRDGVVTLRGTVEPGTLTDLLLRLVASVPGVVGVKSHLEVRGENHAARN